jgi:hypothetical protein
MRKQKKTSRSFLQKKNQKTLFTGRWRYPDAYAKWTKVASSLFGMGNAPVSSSATKPQFLGSAGRRFSVPA